MPIASPQDAPDCIFHSESATGDFGELATDNSWYDDDLTENAAGNIAYEDPAAGRFNLRERFTFDVRLQADDTDNGGLWLIQETAEGATHLLLRISSGGNIIYDFDGTEIIDQAIESWPGGGDPTATYTISVAMEPNPLTTGASDAYRTEVVVINESLPIVTEKVVATHAQPIDRTSSQFVIGAASTSELFGNIVGNTRYTGTILEVRVSSSFHTVTETVETFVDTTITPPTHAGIEFTEQPMPTVSSGAGSNGVFAGPIGMMGALSVRHTRSLLLSPLVNELISDEASTLLPIDSSDPTDEIDTGNFAYMGYLWRRPVPPGVNRLKCRMQIQSDNDGGSNEAIVVRVYSMNAPGTQSRPSTSPPQDSRYFVEATVPARNDGIGPIGGSWLDFSNLLRIATDYDGFTYLAISLQDTVNHRIYIRSVSIDPVIVST